MEWLEASLLAKPAPAGVGLKNTNAKVAFSSGASRAASHPGVGNGASSPFGD